MVKLYTRTGDTGQTSLLGGKRVNKDHPRIDAYGTVDEANSALGLAASLCSVSLLTDYLREIQDKLFQVGADLAQDSSNTRLISSINEKDIIWLEQRIDELEEMKPKQKGFAIPGGTPTAGALDLARTIVRRAERLCITLAREEDVNTHLLKYLNRLSDLLFVIARVEEHESLVKEITHRIVKKMPGVMNNINLDRAKKLVQAAEKCAMSIAVPMVIAVVDNGGNLVLCHRMDDSLLASIDIALNKAYTAVAVKIPTHKLATMSQPGQPLYGIEIATNGGLVLFGGGYPIYEKGTIVGGLGVSGGTVEEDMHVAEEALNKAMVSLEGVE